MTDRAFKATRAAVADLFEPRPWIYWCDFLGSLALGYAGSAAALTRGPLAWEFRLVGWLLTVVMLYRVSLFMHEICHLRRNQMRSFKIVWNVLAGIPMLIPSFFYESHREHHNTHHYGTKSDGEYLPLARSRLRDVAAYFAQVLYLPLLAYFRHLVVTPLSFAIPPLRPWVLAHWSSFVINLAYERKIRPNDPVGWWMAMEIACHLRALALLVFVLTGVSPWYQPLAVYGIAVGIMLLNHTRTLAAHRYQSGGEAMSLEGQLLDSIDVTARDPLTLILCPIGLRFHALHHLFPGMPYHNLHRAHERLVRALPSDHPYHRCVYQSIWSALADLMANIRSGESDQLLRQRPEPECRGRIPA
jgi:fatty acid desaturase